MPRVHARTAGSSVSQKFETNVADFLLSGKDPAKLALRTLDASYTFSDLERGAVAVAQFLMRLGCSSQDRVILLAENSFFWAAAYLGTLKAGLVCVPLPPKTISVAELSDVVRQTEARVVFAQAGVAVKYRASLAGLHLATDRPLDDLPEPASQCAFAALQAEEINRILRCLPFIPSNLPR
jgi:acyl-CoA synthetase (AMP-forming)/AMP-acid ligase II